MLGSAKAKPVAVVEYDPAWPEYFEFLRKRVAGAIGYAPGPGYVWVDGFWNLRGSHWVWINGRWARPPRGRTGWVPDRWERHGEHWRYNRGHWR